MKSRPAKSPRFHPSASPPKTRKSSNIWAASRATSARSAVDGKNVVFADRSVAAMSDFVCGANEAGFHLTGVNFGRDLPEPDVADLRNVVAGDPSPDGKGKLEICRGIEVGHIFQLRQKYAEALKCAILDENGKSQIMEMGCYGIGVSRIVGAAIEQGNDERGIIFCRRPSPPSRFASCRWATTRATPSRLRPTALRRVEDGRHRCHAR
jgi:hypothetical protein